MTPPEHEHTAAITEAARWLAETPANQKPHPVIPHLRNRFGLTIAETIEAIAEAKKLREAV
ncbi:MAG: hypothetical protein KDJ63_09225 [Nitratireductor sp.]|nr:hypothetical protein [Nitratireductor sp.]